MTVVNIIGSVIAILVGSGLGLFFGLKAAAHVRSGQREWNRLHGGDK